jgi:preprotein translocase subunit SecE
MDKITTYFKGVRSESKHINWPSRRDVISYTVVVIAISLLVAGMLGLFDVLLTEIVKTI